MPIENILSSATVRKFGDYIRSRRIAQGVTTDELASKSGIAPARIGQIDRGAHSPTYRELSAIARVLGFNPRDAANEIIPPLTPESLAGIAEVVNSAKKKRV
ncbi:helix-turn-helix transcriptional regulator [Candidatus Uhrbacteria bacterium]|nr:helix-turn-helix transcriptional regulator [Candidatus Uhrbacteria bacterium]